MVDTQYNLLMLSGDSSIARGVDGAFYQMLGRFAQYWQRIDILTPTAPDASERVIHSNVHVHPAPMHRALQPLFIKRKGQALFAERDYHLVTSHDFGFFYNGIGAHGLLRGKNIPLISEIHHIEGFPMAASFREKLWLRAAQWYIPFVAKHGAYFRVVNQQVSDYLQQLGVSEQHIRLLYSLYLDFDVYHPMENEKQVDVLFVARLSANKGVMILLEAIRIVQQSHPDISLAIRGDGALKQQMLDFIAAHNLVSNVEFLPRLEDTVDMPRLYNSAKILVCASTVEGNPRVTIEAMACGTPVVSTRVGIMPDVITHGENGLLVDWEAENMAQTIKQLLDDESLYEAISEAGIQSVQSFDAETIIRDYALAYHQIIQTHQGA